MTLVFFDVFLCIRMLDKHCVFGMFLGLHGQNKSK